MQSIVSYKDRGNYGNSKYRGNCTGYIIKDLLNHFYPTTKPKKFTEIFSGGGTGKDVAKELNITNSLHLDLNNGWDALIDEIPSGSDFIFSHPPYWDIISYETQRNSYSKNDLSNQMPYEEFIHKLNIINEKIYHSLLYGGRHALLVGDVKKQGKYYSIIKDMTWFGDLESHIIKIQHNCMSDNKVYINQSFIPIKHEHLLVFKKNKIWLLNEKLTNTIQVNIMEVTNITWRDLIQATLEYLKNRATVDDIYNILVKSKKAQNNNHIREKIRQTLNNNSNFTKIDNIWSLCIL
ncbi:MAG: hypothetical protein HFJ52_08880 [Clostridia bacterium]|nr:hypothetical protein [Clostridia bacterium]